MLLTVTFQPRMGCGFTVQLLPHGRENKTRCFPFDKLHSIAENIRMSDIYDSAFRTILNDCSKFILPLINEAFGEHYTGDETITFFPNEHFIAQEDDSDKKRIVDTNFSVIGVTEKHYHWEVQSTTDSKMLIRLFEYDAQIALDQGESGTETLTVEFPHSAVLYLRSTSKTPDRYRYVIKTPGGTVEYDIPILKIKSYPLEEIFEKKLYLLLPFYIFTFEADFTKYETDSVKLAQLKAEYATIAVRLTQLEKDGAIAGYDKYIIAKLTESVVQQLAAKYEHILQGVNEIMSGPIIELEGRKYKEEGLREGRAEGRAEGQKEGVLKTYFDLVKSGLLSLKVAASKLGMTESAFEQQMAAMPS